MKFETEHADGVVAEVSRQLRRVRLGAHSSEVRSLVTYMTDRADTPI